MNRWRVGEDTGSQETDRCPLTGSMIICNGKCVNHNYSKNQPNVSRLATKYALKTPI
jgi:hypothetical protein